MPGFQDLPTEECDRRSGQGRDTCPCSGTRCQKSCGADFDENLAAEANACEKGSGEVGSQTDSCQKTGNPEEVVALRRLHGKRKAGHVISKAS
jgi:hypothetical protein